MISVNRKGEVWVFAEQHNRRLEDTPIELMSKAQQLWQGFQKGSRYSRLDACPAVPNANIAKGRILRPGRKVK